MAVNPLRGRWAGLRGRGSGAVGRWGPSRPGTGAVRGKSGRRDGRGGRRGDPSGGACLWEGVEGLPAAGFGGGFVPVRGRFGSWRGALCSALAAIKST